MIKLFVEIFLILWKPSLNYTFHLKQLILRIINWMLIGKALKTVCITSEAVVSMKHHGPDEGAFYTNEFVGLVHARLSIVDNASGK